MGSWKLAKEFYNAATTGLQNQFSLCLLVHSELFEESDLYEPADKQLGGKAIWNLEEDRLCQKLASVLTKANARTLFLEKPMSLNPMNL